MKKLLKVIPLLVAALVLSACSSSEDNSASSESTTCSPESLATVEAGTLTIATGEPAYYPWVIDDKPESGEGFEAAGNTPSQMSVSKSLISPALITSQTKQSSPSRAARLMASQRCKALLMLAQNLAQQSPPHHSM